ncbi:hypothetical protein [Acinetobacter courvalinii]|uniref:DUF4124 domain-containing protein n=1 Tax=Acinetobacter courvalinii TaxID=280147 RepID=A0AA42L5Q6_9GAMM|nr:hypothetical protein [Acinetobacter courvalinii]MDH0562208.1 hypothetical protein [Acinetobacter courvalinii]
MNKILLILSIMSLSTMANADVYQCKVGNSMVYQDKPCAGSSEQAKQIRDKQNAYKNAQEKRERDKAEWNAKLEPKVGMSTAQAEKSTWGYPDKINKTTNATGITEQWVYRRGSASKYLYFKNGKLTTIQDF